MTSSFHTAAAQARPAPSRGQRGLSLIELMVSLTIGLILMIAIVSTYLGSSAASKMAEAQGRMNDDAQAALSLLTQHIRMTGNNPKQQDYGQSALTDGRNPAPVWAPYGSVASPWVDIVGCDTTFTDVTTAAAAKDLTCGAGTGTNSIAVAYEADATNTPKSTAGLPTDCLGNALTAITTAGTPVNKYTGGPGLTPSDVTYYVAENRFYISNVNGIPNLFCKGNGGAVPQPMVENIETLQIKYGMDKPAAVTNAVTGYLTATQVNDPAGALIGLSADQRAKKVMAVRICVIARSETPVVPTEAPASYLNCDNALTTPTDQYFRRAYSTTVVLRNHVWPS